MKKQLIIWICAAVVMALSASVCLAGDKMQPKPEADAFWCFITEKNPYQGWGYWPGHVGMYPGQSPHGKYLELFANSVALKAAREGKTEMPEGSILVKLNYGKDKETLKAITPMYKAQGYNPEAGDWFWAKYGADGKAMASGKVESCINCHRAQKDNDWIFTEAKD